MFFLWYNNRMAKNIYRLRNLILGLLIALPITFSDTTYGVFQADADLRPASGGESRNFLANSNLRSIAGIDAQLIILPPPPPPPPSCSGPNCSPPPRCRGAKCNPRPPVCRGPHCFETPEPPEEPEPPFRPSAPKPTPEPEEPMRPAAPKLPSTGIISDFVADAFTGSNFEKNVNPEFVTKNRFEYHQKKYQASQDRMTLWIIVLLVLAHINLFFFVMNFGAIRNIYQMLKNNRLTNNPPINMWKVRKIASVFVALLISGQIFCSDVAKAELTTPPFLLYEGSLYDTSGNPITGPHNFRFSFWKSVDAVDTDVVNGIIDTNAPNYLGWQEVQYYDVTPAGKFSLKVGNGNSIPYSIFEENDQDLFLQIEVKVNGVGDGSYELIDTDYTTDAYDRMVVGTVPFSKNADRLDHREAGYEVNQIPYLDSDAQLFESAVPEGTYEPTFKLDSNEDGDDLLSFIFGASLESISWDNLLNTFVISDDLQVEGYINDVPIGPETEHLKLSALYPETVFERDGSDNVGAMHDEREDTGTEEKNILRWTTFNNNGRIDEMQDYDVVIAKKIPDHFVNYQPTSITLEYKTDDDATKSKIDFTVDKGGTDQFAGAGLSLSSMTSATLSVTGWDTKEISLDPNTTWTAGETMFLRLKMYATQIGIGAPANRQNYDSRIGDIIINFSKQVN